MSAYNEQDCIKEVLLSVLSQKQDGFILEKIIVVSDGSDDKTDELVKSIKDHKVQLIADGKRRGKAQRMNEIFEISKSDILVILDTDIEIKSLSVLRDLIDPIVNQNADLTSGKLTPIRPKSFVQKAVYMGTKLWDEARKMNKNKGMYYCGGAIRAFSKRLYKEMRFPKIKAEDIYPYLYCKSKGYKFVYAEKAEIFYPLPSRLDAYIKQMNRYLASPIEQKTVYDNKLVSDEFSIGPKIKLYVLFKEFVKNPFWVSAYLAILVIPKTQVLLKSYTNENSYR